MTGFARRRAGAHVVDLAVGALSRASSTTWKKRPERISDTPVNPSDYRAPAMVSPSGSLTVGFRAA